MPNEVLLLSSGEVESLLDPDTAIDSQREAFAALGERTADLPGKIMDPSRHNDSVVFCYASRLSADTGAVCKFGSVNPGNVPRGLPSVSAVIVALDPDTGQLVAFMDGAAVTTARTAAASAVAASALSVEEASHLAVLGSGVQGRAHVRAIVRVRPIRSVRIWSPSPVNRVAAAAQLADELGLAVQAAATAEEAVADAHVVATCTLSAQPVVRGSWLPKGCTVVSIGSFEPARREVDAAVLGRASAIVVDDPGTAMEHAGPIVEALRSRQCKPDDLIALSDVVVGRVAARTTPEDIVFYNSVGLGVQDAAAAWAVIRRARQAEVGTWVQL